MAGEKSLPESTKIKFYGTSWCPSSRRAQKFLSSKNIEFEWINIDKDIAGREFVIKVNNGNRSVPTILFPDGEILVEPSNAELAKKVD
jgi:mycoredoxin